METQVQSQRFERSSNALAVLNTSVVFSAAGSLQEWADRVTHAWRQSVASIVAVGQLLIEAKATVAHGDWAKLFRGHRQAVARPMPVSQHTAEHLMRIARHPTLSNSTHGSNLLTSWRTLAELARLPAATVEQALARGQIHPEMMRAEVHTFFFRQPVSTASTRTAQSYGISISTLQDDEEMLRRWATELAVELAAPLQFSADGRIVSGVWWLPSIPSRTVSRPSVHRCTCPTCGHTHVERRS